MSVGLHGDELARRIIYALITGATFGWLCPH
jgi:hypothetical protein